MRLYQFDRHAYAHVYHTHLYRWQVKSLLYYRVVSFKSRFLPPDQPKISETLNGAALRAAPDVMGSL